MKVTLRERKRRNKKTYFFLDIYNNGERKQESLNLWYDGKTYKNRDIKEMAEKKRLEKENQLKTTSFLSRSRIDFVAYFEDNCKDHNYDSTLRLLKTFPSKANYNTRIDKINEKFIEDLIDHFKANVSVNTAYNYLSKIKAVLNMAVKDKIIPSSPAKFISIKRKKANRENLTAKELQILAKTQCDHEEVKLAFLFACGTGLRISDIKNLTWGKIKDELINYRQLKTDEIEWLPLSPSSLQILALKKKNENVLPLPDLHVFNLPTLSPIEKFLKRWVKKAKINKKITFHCSRHTYAVQALLHG